MFLEVFAGCGNMSRHVRRHGKAALAIDIHEGDWCDICKNDVFNTLKGWIQSGMVWGLWLGTPCNGLSQARRGPPGSKMPNRLRDRNHLRGLAGLAPRDQKVLANSNLMMDRAGILQRLAYDHGVPGGEENPASSFLWQMPGRQRFGTRSNVVFENVDYCACGRPFRARTRLCLWHHRPAPQLHTLKCHGRGVCDFSGKPHLQLSGTSGQGFLTGLKNQYPDRLCKLVSGALVQAYEGKRTARLWNLMR